MKMRRPGLVDVDGHSSRMGDLGDSAEIGRDTTVGRADEDD